MDSSEQVAALHLFIEQHAPGVNGALFYIDSPADLICSAPFLRNEGGKGVLHPGPGGRFYDFLMPHNHANVHPIIISNYDHFDAEDIARFSQLLDDKPFVDGVHFSANIQRIGLINSKKLDAYKGEDFYSKFDTVSPNPFAANDWLKELKALPFIDAQDAHTSEKIELYHAQDWKERLLGTWLLQKNQFVWQEGLLAQALSKGCPIAIHNGLWDNAQFHRFWQQAYARGYIDYEQGRLVGLDKVQIIKHEGYDWPGLTAWVTFVEHTENAQVLNPSCLREFLQSYQCDNTNKTLDTLPGLIEQHANGHLSVHLTRSISDDDWARLLDACHQHKVQLLCSRGPAVALPEPLRTLAPTPKPALCSAWDSQLRMPNTLIIKSNEPDTTIALLQQKQGPYQVIDVSECSASDLLTQLTAVYDKKNNTFQFNQTTQALVQGLEQQQKILLTGTFSAELSDALASLLLTRYKQGETNKGELIIISSDTTGFDFLPQQQHQVTIQAKQHCLALRYSQEELSRLNKELWAKEHLSQLNARLVYQRIYGFSANSNDAWKGLTYLPEKIKLNPFDAQNSAAIAHEFILQRVKAINEVLKHAPYVFLTGLTGVGKSTFVEKYFNSDDNVLYQGESQLLAWAQDTSAKQKILFIDEANLSERQWSEFEGLFNNPPSILINGVQHRLSPQHKVIFAGNPLSYGDERHLAPFFMRHGNALVFEPMPQEFIYEAILKPVFSGSNVDPLLVCRPLLEVYRFVCECAKDKVLLSPRELQMMALMVLSYAHQQSSLTQASYQQAAEYYAYQLAYPLLPKAHQKAFDVRFKPKTNLPELLQASLVQNTSDFVVTPSRKEAARQLEELLLLRDYRRSHASNEAQAYGGLGGMIIEGMPSEGKSHLVSAALRAHGYKEADANTSSSKEGEKVFYRIAAGMPMEEKKRILLKAFNEGAVVVIKGINSASMMERELNSLLMGRTLAGKRPDRPGFLVIGIQHPSTTPGRRPASTALARRMIHTALSSYPVPEMHAILMKKGIGNAMSSMVLRSYQKMLAHAQQHQLSPAPTFIDVQKVAERLIPPLPIPVQPLPIPAYVIATASSSQRAKPQKRKNEPPQSEAIQQQEATAKASRKRKGVAIDAAQSLAGTESDKKIKIKNEDDTSTSAKPSIQVGTAQLLMNQGLFAANSMQQQAPELAHSMRIGSN